MVNEATDGREQKKEIEDLTIGPQGAVTGREYRTEQVKKKLPEVIETVELPYQKLLPRPQGWQRRQEGQGCHCWVLLENAGRGGGAQGAERPAVGTIQKPALLTPAPQRRE